MTLTRRSFLAMVGVASIAPQIVEAPEPDHRELHEVLADPAAPIVLAFYGINGKRVSPRYETPADWWQFNERPAIARMIKPFTVSGWETTCTVHGVILERMGRELVRIVLSEPMACVMGQTVQVGALQFRLTKV